MFFGVVGLSNFVSLGIVLIVVQDLQNRNGTMVRKRAQQLPAGALGQTFQGPEVGIHNLVKCVEFSPSNLEP